MKKSLSFYLGLSRIVAVIALSMIVITSCSKKQLIKTELKTVYKIKYRPLNPEILKPLPRVQIKEQSSYSDVIQYLIKSLNYNVMYEQRLKSIDKLTQGKK